MFQKFSNTEFSHDLLRLPRLENFWKSIRLNFYEVGAKLNEITSFEKGNLLRQK